MHFHDRKVTVLSEIYGSVFLWGPVDKFSPLHYNDVLMDVMATHLDCFTSHVGEHRTVRGLWERQGIPCFFKIPTVQQSPKEETPFVYVTLATLVTLATAGYTPCLFGYVTIGLARHNRTHFSQSERLLVKPQRPCTDLCAEPVGVWNRLRLTSHTIIYSIVHSGADQRKHQSSVSLAFVWRIHRWPVNSPHKGPVTRKMFPFDEVIILIR